MFLSDVRHSGSNFMLFDHVGKLFVLWTVAFCSGYTERRTGSGTSETVLFEMNLAAFDSLCQTEYCLFVFRAQQLWEEGRDTSGWISARTGFHASQTDDVRIQILPWRRAVRAGHRSATRPQDRHPGGVRGHTVTVSIESVELGIIFHWTLRIAVHIN